MRVQFFGTCSNSTHARWYFEAAPPGPQLKRAYGVVVNIDLNFGQLKELAIATPKCIGENFTGREGLAKHLTTAEMAWFEHGLTFATFI